MSGDLTPHRGAALLRAMVEDVAAVAPEAAAELWRAEALRLSPEELKRTLGRMPLVDQVHVLSAARRQVEDEHRSAAANVELAETIGVQVGRWLGVASLLGLPLFGLPSIVVALDRAVTLLETGDVRAALPEIRGILDALAPERAGAVLAQGRGEPERGRGVRG